MKYAIGLMSGTSLDGLDVALVKIDGHSANTKLELIDFQSFAYNQNFKEKMMKAIKGEMNIREYCSLNFELPILWSGHIIKVINDNKLKSSDIAFIGSHGQTIYHLIDPTKDEFYSTLQLGDGSVLANLLGITVVSDFRPADMAVGGQGAPIVPYTEYVLYQKWMPK